jgi:two-component system alkaline phosphatase synthesis response regulator PhoP
MATILIVEDEVELNHMVGDYLKRAGHSIRHAYDGSGAVKEVFQNPPDLVVLDLNLPGLAGIDVARTVTDQTGIPIIIVSARGEEEDRLAGFSAGVDDYMVKPFSLPELQMRIAAVLRRTAEFPKTPANAPDGATHPHHPKHSQQPEHPQPTRFSVGDLVIDEDRRSVTVGGTTAELTAAQFDILAAMARSPGRVFTRAKLLETFQDHAFEGYERTVDVHIGKIRKQIEDDPSAPTRLTTVWGVGYRLEES